MFCSPFRRRNKDQKAKIEETYLTTEEAWQMYLNKLDEEANYFTVGDEEADADICTCTTCVVSMMSDFRYMLTCIWQSVLSVIVLYGLY
jgi:hypothetical protein